MRIGEINPEFFKNISSDTPPLIIRHWKEGILKAGDKILTSAMHPEMDEHVDLTFPVALDEPGILPQVKPIIDLLREFSSAVWALISKFESFL